MNKAIDFIKSQGYKNISDFARAVNDNPSNVRKVLIGKQKPDIKKCFIYANALHCTIDQVLMIFYSDLMTEHIRLYNERI